MLCPYLDSVAGIGQTPESQSAWEGQFSLAVFCTDARRGKPYLCNLQLTLFDGDSSV